MLLALLLLAACGDVPTLGIDTPAPVYNDETGVLPPVVLPVTGTTAADVLGLPTVPRVTTPGGAVVPETFPPTDPYNPPVTGSVTLPPTNNPVTNPPTNPPVTSPKVALKKPDGVAAIAAFYNEATARVNNSRAGYRKTLVSQVPQDKMTGLDAVPSFAIEPIMGKVNEFMNAGTHNTTITKGQNANQLVSASLSAADLSSASVTESGDNYLLTLKVNSVTNPTRAANNSLGRFSTDFKTAAEGKATLEAGMKVTIVTVKPTVGTVNITLVSATITASINKYTGQPVSIKHHLDWTAELLNVVAKAGMKVEVPRATGVNIVDVTYTNFAF
jgi:hypothetical protein